MSKTAFLFPGQGAQAIGMGKDLYDQSTEAKETFHRANEILGYDLAEICFNGPAETLNSTVHSQPALFLTSYLALQELRKQNPDLVESCSGAAGLSLGEYTALVFAEAIGFEDGLRLVQKRGEAMQAAADQDASGMVSILGMDLEAVEGVCDRVRREGRVLQVANHLCPGNIVVSGHADMCESVAAEAEKSGAMKTIPLAVAGAFHTELMQPAVEQLTEALDRVTISQPKITFLSNVDASEQTDPEKIRELLIRQVCSPVLWENSMRNFLDSGFDQFFEIGPGRVLRGLMKRINRKVSCQGALDS